MIMASLIEHVSQHLGIAMARQMALSDYLGEHNWQVNMDAERIIFNGNQAYPIQLLGSESSLDNTWLWIWANAAALEQFPPSLFRDASQIRRLGEAEGITELTTDTTPMSAVSNGSVYSALAVGVSGAACYYRCPYENGALFCLIYDVPLTVKPLPLERTATVIMQILQYGLPHKAVITPFLEQQGYGITIQDNRWIAEDSAKRQIQLTFDDLDRMSGLTTSISR
jgi:hypothetical protein